MTKLVNLKTGETAILGQSVARFAKLHGLNRQRLNSLITSRLPFYRHWALEKTVDCLRSDA
jgi:hypothetical protein